MKGGNRAGNDETEAAVVELVAVSTSTDLEEAATLPLDRAKSLVLDTEGQPDLGGALPVNETSEMQELKQTFERQRAIITTLKRDQCAGSKLQKNIKKPKPKVVAKLEQVGKVPGDTGSPCKHDSVLGWPPGKNWKPKQWSNDRPVGFNGIESRTEQYQVNHADCEDECNARPGGQNAGNTSEGLLKAAAGPQTSSPLVPATVSAGKTHTCATSEDGRGAHSPSLPLVVCTCCNPCSKLLYNYPRKLRMHF